MELDLLYLLLVLYHQIVIFFSVIFWFFNSLPHGKNSNILIIAAFCNSPFSGTTSSPAKDLHLSIFRDGTAKILTVFLAKSFFAIVFIF